VNFAVSETVGIVGGVLLMLLGAGIGIALNTSYGSMSDNAYYQQLSPTGDRIP
jgi:hypothetical protein